MTVYKNITIGVTFTITLLMNYIGIVLSSNITNNRINGHHSCNVIQDLDSSQNYLKKLPVYKN